MSNYLAKYFFEEIVNNSTMMFRRPPQLRVPPNSWRLSSQTN